MCVVLCVYVLLECVLREASDSLMLGSISGEVCLSLIAMQKESSICTLVANLFDPEWFWRDSSVLLSIRHSAFFSKNTCVMSLL